MLITPFKSKAAQILRFRGAATIANTFAVRPGVLLLLVIFLLLPLSVYAQSQTEIKDAKPTTIFGMAETAPVVVNGRVRFHVVGVTA